MRSIAAFSAIFQDFHPSQFLSTSTVILPVDFNLSLFLSPSGAQVSALFVLLYPFLLRVHLHCLIFIPSEIGDTELFTSNLKLKTCSVKLVFNEVFVVKVSS